MPLITTKEMYEPLRDLTMPQRYAMFRLLTHIADHAARDDYYKRILASIDFARLQPDMLTFVRAVCDSSPYMTESLSPTQMTRLHEARPVTPPIKLVENPCGIRAFARWELLL